MPSTGWLVLAVAAGTVAVGAFSVFGLGTAAGADQTRLSLSGAYLGQVAVVALAALAVTTEYDTGMIRGTLAAAPRRGRVLAGKAFAVTAVTLCAGALGVAGSYLCARLAFSPGPALMWRPHAGTVLYLGLIGLLTLGLALIIRHTGGTITVVLSLLFTVPATAALITDPVWRERILRVAPMTAGLAIQATTDLDALPIAPWAGLGVLAGYAGGALVVGTMLFLRRDA
ncbi:MAG TPA: ABC transporter permease [Actinophytocola sp.]|uniref:ABC transporter permease n=1 Tax=Actinophytocola sp. TaxID=1872138 RepID=UPI002DBA2995|nr:ABC transporter permease [Actinophytocola sp.]HEU5475272.1 ABC transporter permease [Actinophytocola sp.]